MIGFRKYAFGFLICLSCFTSCNPGGDGPGSRTEFDRQAMLTNYSDLLIVPGYQRFKTETGQLAAAVQAFATTPSLATLTEARAKFQAAYLGWQEVSLYEFGPADDQMLRNSLNIYPTSPSQIEQNVTSGTYNLQASANLAAKGFPALDYLLYAKPNEQEVLGLYTSAAHSANRKKYVQDVANLVKQQAEAVHTGWTSGTYGKTFKESPGTAVGSAVGNLVNQLNFEIDLTKRAKVGIPSGRFTAGTPLPDKVEAYYSRTSLALLERAIKAQRALFVGQTAQETNGLGLEEYLDHVGAKHNNRMLSEAIKQQFDAALAAVAAVPAPLAEAVTAHPQAVSKVYEELQKLIVLTKTDMPAALGVSITYTDNDGD